MFISSKISAGSCRPEQFFLAKTTRILKCYITLIGCFLISFTTEVRAQEFDTFPVSFLTKDSAAFDYWPCFSPDGKTVIFSRTLDFKTWDLLSVSSQGGDVKRFSDKKLPISITRANWSYTHNIIAFTGISNDGKNSVWLIDADGKNARQLKIDSLSNQNYYPSWYPDGLHLAVLDAAEHVIKRVNIQNHKAITITENKKVLTGMPSVSPDGSWIAFAGQENIGKPYDQTKNSIWPVNETSNLHLLENEAMQGRTPAWSSGGKWIAFESNRGNSEGLYAIFVIKNDGTSLQRITPFEYNANHPVWSPDGKKILFSSGVITNEKKISRIAIIDISNGLK